MKISRYSKLGFLVIFCLAVLIWGINFLKGIDFFKNVSNYYVVYDKIEGLNKSSAITLNGFKIGQVSNIQFTKDYSGKLLVTLSVEGNFKIMKGSVARIVSSDIMGTKSIKIEIKQSPEFYADGDTIPGSVESDLKEQVSMQVLPLKQKAEELLASLDSALTVVTYVFNERTRQNLTESFEHINRTIANVQATSDQLRLIMEKGNIQSILSNTEAISQNLKNNSGKIQNIVGNISSISDSIAKLDIAQMGKELQASIAGLNQIIAQLNASDNSAGMLLNDPALYQNLVTLSSSLDLLMKDLRNNPKRYVHFSAFKLGKDVYITSKPSAPNKQDAIIYKVYLISSPAKLSLDSKFFEGLGPIEETLVSETYNYMAGGSADIQETNALLEKARVMFPDATIVAFKNGRKIKLERAIQKLSKQ